MKQKADFNNVAQKDVIIGNFRRVCPTNYPICHLNEQSANGFEATSVVLDIFKAILSPC